MPSTLAPHLDSSDLLAPPRLDAGRPNAGPQRAASPNPHELPPAHVTRDAFSHDERVRWWSPKHWRSTLSEKGARKQADLAIRGVLPPDATVSPALGVVGKEDLRFYVAGEGANAVFIKVRRCGRPNAPWREKAIALEASTKGFAPRTYPGAQAPQALVMDYQSGETLSFAQAQTQAFKQSFVPLLRRLHETQTRPSLPVPAKAGVPSWLAWRARDYAMGPANKVLLDVASLAAIVDATLGALETRPVIHMFCHYDTLPRNIYLTPAGARLIDWEMARMGDPLRDLAKCFASVRLGIGEAWAILEMYFGRCPSEDEHRHFLRHMLAQTADVYAHRMVSKREQHGDSLQRAEQLLEYATGLGAIDAQRWWCPDADTTFVASARLYAAAHAAAKDILGVNFSLSLLDSSRAGRGNSTYRAQGKSGDLFIKIEGLNSGKPPSLERDAAQEAAHLGLSPAYHPTPNQPYAIVTNHLSGSTLTFEQTLLPSVRRDFVHRLKRLHDSRPAVTGLAPGPWDIGGWTRWRDALFATPRGNRPLIDCESLAQHMRRVCEEIERVDVAQVPCHYDTLRRNIILANDRVWLVDWGLAKLGDPLRDLAKFFGFNGLFAHEAATILEWYFGRRPTDFENRRFLLWLQAMAVDHYSYAMKSDRDRTRGAQHKVPQILSLGAALADFPALTQTS